MLEDAAVRVAVEVGGVDDLRREVERVVVDQDGAEHGTLGFQIVRKRTLRSGNDSISHERGEAFEERAV